MEERTSKGYFVPGGTLPGNVPSYVEREADAVLFKALLAGEFCYVLDTRQVGKSSLIVRMAQQLRAIGHHAAILDISSIGENLTQEQWYFGLLTSLAVDCDLEAEAEEFWIQHSRLGSVQRLFMAIRDIFLPRLNIPFVIFVDEIDAVRKLPFSVDEFFAAIRECHNRRASHSGSHQLTFCLMGVATPSDLIQDVRTTPFNIGRRIELHDFSLPEMLVFAAGLPGNNVQQYAQLKQVWCWTAGHPYLTQKFCQAVANAGQPLSSSEIDSLCAQIFLRREAQEEENNLKFVSRYILTEEAHRTGILTLYNMILTGRYIHAEDAPGALVQHLLLSGLVCATTRGKQLRIVVRNRIYRTVFDLVWIRQAMPGTELRRQRRAWWLGFARATIIWGIAAASLGMAWRQRMINRWTAQKAVVLTTELSHQRAMLSKNEKQIDTDTKLLHARQADLLRMEQTIGHTKTERDRIAQEKQTLQASVTVLQQRLALLQGSMNQAVTVRNQALRDTLQAQEQSESEHASALAVQSGDEVEAVQSSLHSVETTMKAGRKPSLAAQQALFSAVTARAHRIRRIPHDGRLTAASFSSDDQYLVIAGRGRYADLISTHNWQPTVRLPVVPADIPNPEVAVARFALRGTRLVTAYRTGSAESCFQVWDVANVLGHTIAPMRTFRCKTLGPPRADLSADGTLIVTNGPDKTGRVWTIADGSICELKGHAGPVTGVSFSSDLPGHDRFVATIGNSLRQDHDQEARIWDAHTGKCLYNIGPDVQAANRQLTAVAFSHFADLVLLGSVEGNLIAYHGPAASNQQRGTESLQYHGAIGKINTIHVSTDSGWVASANARGNTQIWYKPQHLQPMYSLATRTHEATAVQFSRSDRKIVTASKTGYADVWSLGQSTYQGAEGTLTYVDCSPDGTAFAAASDEGCVLVWQQRRILWDTATHTMHAFFDPIRRLQWDGKQIDHAVYSPDGQRIAMACTDGSARIWTAPAATGSTANDYVPLIGHTDRINTIFFSADGRSVVTASRDQTVRVWDAHSGRQTAQLPDAVGGYLSAIFQRDGQHILIATTDGTARRYDLISRRWQEVYTVKGDRGPGPQRYPLSIAFSPDEHAVLSADADGNAYLWNTTSAHLLGVFHASDSPLFSALFSPDGRRLVTTGADGVTRTWCIPTVHSGEVFHQRKPELVVHGNGLRMNIARFTPDGQHLVVAGEDKLVQFYPATLGEMRKSARNILAEAGSSVLAQ